MPDFGLGHLVTQSDATFENRRQALVWQAIKPDRYPHSICKVGSRQDIVDALAYARRCHLRVSIVSGGHSYIGHGVQDGTLLMDLSCMKEMAIDAETRSGWIEPGVRVAEFDTALERAGLAFPIGHDPNVGLIGYLLGGGMGWNPESWGSMACFNITAAEIVLASGELVVADSHNHVDLFWAVRGAGPNFCGVVTRLHVRLFARPSVIRKSDYAFSLDGLEGMLAWLARMLDGLDDRIELSMAFLTSADTGDAVRRQKQCVVSLIVFAESDAEAAMLTDPFVQSVPGEGLVSSQESMPRTFAKLLDEAKGDRALRRIVESVWTDDPFSSARAAADALVSAPSDDAIIYIGLRRRDRLAMDAACSILGRGFVFIDAAWRNGIADEINRLWMDRTLIRLHPYDNGGYINETDWYRRPERIARCYQPQAAQRLKDINMRHDEKQMFVKPLDFVRAGEFPMR